MISGNRVVRHLIGLALFGLALEAFARIDDRLSYDAPVLHAYSDRLLYTRDSLGTTGRPSARFRKWRLNSFGYRGPEPEPRRLTIVCLGASETFGLYEAEDHEYPRQLEQKLNAFVTSPKFQVVNAALPGESALTANRRLKQIIADAHPRVVLIYPTPADYIWLPYLKPEPTAPVAVPTPPREKFEWRLAERARTFAKGLLPEMVQTELRNRMIARAAADFRVMDTLPDENIRRFHDDVTALVKNTLAHGAVPVIVTHASALGGAPTAADRGLLTSWRKFYPMLKEDGFPNMERRMNAALRAVASEQGVRLIDVAPQVAERRYFADYVHFTDSGASVMAENLAEGLVPLLRQELPEADWRRVASGAP